MKSINRLYEIVEQSFKDSYELAGGSKFRYFHSLNVSNIVIAICESENISKNDCQLVQVAALFHDISKKDWITEDGFLDGSKGSVNNTVPHEIASSEYVVNELREYFTSSELEMISDIVRTHDHPISLLAKVLHDADELSEMGVMNIWKMIQYSAYKKRDIQFTIDYWVDVDRQRHNEKIEGLYFEFSKDMAKQRVSEVDEYFSKLQRQVNNN